MLHPELVRYLEEMRENGFTETRARKRLQEAGWDEKLIEEAMSASDSPMVESTRNSPRAFFEYYKRLVVSPGAFLDDAKGVTGYWPLLRDLAIIYAVLFGISMLLSVPSGMGQNELGPLALFFSVPLAVIFIILMVWIVVFVGAAVDHLGVLIVGGRNGYASTFKAVTYSMVIYSLYNVVTTILLLITGIIEPQGGVASLYTLSVDAATPLSNAISGFVGLVSMVHVVIVLVMGISRFHDLSTGRSTVAVFLIPLLIGVILLVLFATFFAFLLGGLVA